jgi:hypothetical protein
MQAVKLKSVPKPVEKGPPGKNLVAEEARLQAILRAVDLEYWYPFLEQFTFKTTTVPLTVEEAKIMVDAYKANRSSNVAGLEELEKRISHVFKTMPGGAFAKLSSRSPKDSTACERKALDAACSEILGLKQRGVAVSVNDIYCAVVKSSISCLKCNSASDALEAFLTSDRVCSDDLPLALSFASKSWTQNIVLRKVLV